MRRGRGWSGGADGSGTGRLEGKRRPEGDGYRRNAWEETIFAKSVRPNTSRAAESSQTTRLTTPLTTALTTPLPTPLPTPSLAVHQCLFRRYCHQRPMNPDPLRWQDFSRKDAPIPHGRRYSVLPPIPSSFRGISSIILHGPAANVKKCAPLSSPRPGTTFVVCTTLRLD